MRFRFCSSLVLKFGFKKIAKKNDYIRIDNIGDAFRHAGQNPTEDTVKDMIEKAKALKDEHQRQVDPGSSTCM
jgi:Ca2+-binding EF-hand superfamily protein